MMVFAVLLLAASSNPSHPSWMVGTWGWQNAGEKGTDCGSDHDSTYNRDGTYDFMDETGTWRVEGNRIIETMTDPGGTGDPKARGKPNIIRFKRVSPGILEVAGEYPGKLIKCPAS